MRRVLVTGGTGRLGRPTVRLLTEAGHDVKVLSRRPHGPQVATGDLRTGTGVGQALEGIDTVVHLATTPRNDERCTALLVGEATRAGVGHLLYVSIVGVDKIPLPYYQHKLGAEGLIEQSAVDSTVLRATQFHDLVVGMFAAQQKVPFLLAPAFSFQPIDVLDVAVRLAELVESGPAGRTADIGGPETTPATDLARSWARAAGIDRTVRTVRLPGKIFAAYAAGAHLVPGAAYGTGTFGQFLAARYPRSE